MKAQVILLKGYTRQFDDDSRLWDVVEDELGILVPEKNIYISGPCDNHLHITDFTPDVDQRIKVIKEIDFPAEFLERIESMNAIRKAINDPNGPDTIFFRDSVKDHESLLERLYYDDDEDET